MARKQQTNSLDRFRKHSPRLVLEEHTHCEIPAGCGGVVLRWRNPRAAQPYQLHAWIAAREWTARIDGEPLMYTRFDLAPGWHALTFVLDDADLSSALLACVLQYAPPERTSPAPPHPRDVATAGDHSWRATLTPPPDGWDAATFDASAWSILHAVAAPTLDDSDEGRYRFGHINELGGVCLALAGGRGRGPVWLRRLFQVAPPE